MARSVGTENLCQASVQVRPQQSNANMVVTQSEQNSSMGNSQKLQAKLEKIFKIGGPVNKVTPENTEESVESP